MLINDKLSYIAVSTRDIDSLHNLFFNSLGLNYKPIQMPDGGVINAYGVGETAVAVFPNGSSFLSKNKPGVDHIAFSSDSPVNSASLLIEHPKSILGLKNMDQIPIPSQLTEDVNIRFTTDLGVYGQQTNFVERLDHIGIASIDNASVETTFTNKLGLKMESRQTDMEVKISVESFTSDKYGVVYKNRPPEPMGGLRVSFITAGDTELEFLQNFNAHDRSEVHHGTPGNTKQDQGAITNYIEKYGRGLHHLAFKTYDINQTLKHLKNLGYRLIDTVGRPGSRQSLIGFMHPSSTGGILIHFVERQEILND